jgi:predicted ATPase/DNA-binding winged helix-turn-helix (wHTH) protein
VPKAWRSCGETRPPGGALPDRSAWNNLPVQFQFGEFQLDDQRFTLVGPTGPIHLEPQVFGVLHYLIVNRDRVVSKEEMLDGVWDSQFVSESALTSRVKAARRAIGDDGRSQRIIQTVHGRGYRFIADVQTPAEAVHRALTPLRSVPIGRGDDIRGVIKLVRANALVTVTGSGGVGKTTLALAIAHELRAEFPDGAIFVDLATVPTGADVTRAIADGAGLEGAAAKSVTSVADHLADRPALLVLDNCEHVLERAAEFVDRVLGYGARAHLLATSREPLRVAGEHVWPLGPLTEAGPELFVQRARAAEPRVPWNPADPKVIELCDRLDNVPLALELAAGQLRRFALDELAHRLESHPTLLSRREIGDSARHATMESTIDWSYQLLDHDEQRLLRHLSVFPSYFDLAAVEESAPPLASTASIDVFGQLVDKSLVVRDPVMDRYRLLETIRFFARQLLDQSAEASDAEERHRQYVLQRIRSSSRLDRWLSASLAAGYRRDLENIRQAFLVCIRRGHIDDAVEIAVGAAFLWRNAMAYTEGDDWLRALHRPDLVPRDELWLRILRADLGLGRGDYREMTDATSTATQQAGTADDPAAACLVMLYQAIVHLTDAAQANLHLTQATELADAAGESRLGTLVESFRAAADLIAEDYDIAHERLSGLDRTASRDGYDRFITHWVGWTLAIAERDGAAARRWMGAQQDFLDRSGIVETWLSSFSAAMTQIVAGGEFRGHLNRALTLADREGYRAEADCVLVPAYAELCAHRYEAAAELMGTAVRGRFNTTAHYVLYRVVLDRAVRKHLDPHELDDALTRGRTRTAAEVLAGHGISAVTAAK